jgi:curved DNA-binding protein CbpA
LELWEHDLYDLLGVSEDATGDDIKKAFKSLASELHPDRYPDDEEKCRLASAQFAKVSAAYQTLKDDEMRAEYDFARRMGFGGQNALKLTMASGDLSAVIDNAIHEANAKKTEELQASQARAGQAKNQYDQGVAYISRKKYGVAINCFKEAIKLDSTVADYHVLLGVAYSKQGLDTMAQRCFATAHKLDPRNATLKQHYTPVSGAAKKSQGLFGFLGRLFGKGSQKADNTKKTAKAKASAKGPDKKKTKK